MSNPKLHQILAIESGVRTQTKKDLTAAHHGLQKTEMLFGLVKSYEALDDEGEILPDETKLVQTRSSEVLKHTFNILRKLYDTTAVRDFANCNAKADVTLSDGTVLLKDVPAIYLLWMEKQLEDLHTFVSKLPILPADTEWAFDEKQNCFKSPEQKTARKVKVPYPLVLSPATDKHPANVVEKTRDEIVGYFKTIKYSGAMKAKDVSQMKERVEELQRAVKFAREQANTVEAPKQEIGDSILSFVFGSLE